MEQFSLILGYQLNTLLSIDISYSLKDHIIRVGMNFVMLYKNKIIAE